MKDWNYSEYAKQLDREYRAAQKNYFIITLMYSMFILGYFYPFIKEIIISLIKGFKRA